MCVEFVFVFVLGLCLCLCWVCAVGVVWLDCGLWISGFRGCGSVDCGLWVGSGGLLIHGLPWCVGVIAVV